MFFARIEICIILHADLRKQDKDYTYIMNILTVGLCFFSVLAGLVQRYTHRFKYLQLSGLAIRIM